MSRTGIKWKQQAEGTRGLYPEKMNENQNIKPLAAVIKNTITGYFGQ